METAMTQSLNEMHNIGVQLGKLQMKKALLEKLRAIWYDEVSRDPKSPLLPKLETIEYELSLSS